MDFKHDSSPTYSTVSERKPTNQRGRNLQHNQADEAVTICNDWLRVRGEKEETMNNKQEKTN